MAALAAAGIDSPRLEARILLAHVTGMESNVYDPGRKLSPRQMSEVGRLLERRLAHEPLDKVIGRRDFTNIVLSLTAKCSVRVRTVKRWWKPRQS